MLGRCLLGLADGRRIVLQVLPQPEVIGADDIVISVRMAAYEAKTLSRSIDLPFPRTSTVKALYSTLLAKFPQLNEEPPAGGQTSADEGSNVDAADGSAPAESRVMAVAKGFTSGPALTLKGALKLKWNDPAVLRAGDVQIDRPPLTLRDGSVIVVRGVADFARAKAAAAARREAEGKDSSAGGEASAARARSRSGSRTGKRMFSAASKERGLKINVDGEAPPPPQPSPERLMA